MAKYVLDFINIFAALHKSIVMLLLLTISTVLISKGFLNGGNYTDLMRATIVSYFGATGIEHFSSMVQAHLTSKGIPGAAAVAQKLDSVIVEDGGDK